jgi:hypothetical protein
LQFSGKKAFLLAAPASVSPLLPQLREACRNAQGPALVGPQAPPGRDDPLSTSRLRQGDCHPVGPVHRQDQRLCHPVQQHPHLGLDTLEETSVTLIDHLAFS